MLFDAGQEILTVGAGVQPEVGTSETDGRDVSVPGGTLLVCGED